jgi:hypothetical protein
VRTESNPGVPACQQLSIRFANAVDRWDYDTVISLFVPDGALDRWGTRIVGHAALRDWLNSRPREVVTRHVCTNIQVTREDPRAARGLTYFTYYRATGRAGEPPETLVPSMVGEYHDRFVLTEDGWRIAERAVEVVFPRPKA